MDFRFNQEQEELRTSARAFLQDQSSSDQMRRASESDLGWERDLWGQLSAELGWTSVQIPEQYGGLGLGYVELVALFEIMGEQLFCGPFLSSICLGANALLLAGDEGQKNEWLPAIAEGESRVALAHSGSRGESGPDAVDLEARKEGSDFILTGRHALVVDGHSADRLIVAARTPGSRSAEGIQLFLVEGTAAGLGRKARPTLDPTRRLASLDFESVRVGAEARLGAGDEAWPALEQTLQLGAIALAAEQVGGAQKCLDLSVAYALERVQFGRPIASFQAIKHKCADMMVEVESARSAVYYAACVATQASDELAACASLAKAYCSETYFRCAGDAIQIHGGVGFTWEYDVHLHFKRARSGEQLLGEPAYHRELIAQRIGL